VLVRRLIPALATKFAVFFDFSEMAEDFATTQKFDHRVLLNASLKANPVQPPANCRTMSFHVQDIAAFITKLQLQSEHLNQVRVLANRQLSNRRLGAGSGLRKCRAVWWSAQVALRCMRLLSLCEGR
jgi:hypothetical protein